MGDLKRSQKAFVEQFMGRQTGNVLASHGDTSRRWFKNARDHIEKSGFSGSIWSNQTGNGSFGDLQRRAVNCTKSAKMFVHVLDNYQAVYPPDTPRAER